MTTTEPAEAEVVPVIPEPDHSAAISHVADVALATPGIPARDEFINLCLQAKLLSMSAALPKGVRGNPHLCLHIVLLARDYGVSPATAVNLIDFIPEDKDHPEKGGQLSLSPEFMCARVRNLGLGDVKLLEHERDHAIAVALEPGGYIKRDTAGQVVEVVGEIGRSEFTWVDAQDAGLVDTRCPGPGEHWLKPGGDRKNWKDRCDCRQGYRTYPKRMFGWRAKGYACSDNFPEASLGLYSAEELGADVDDEGRPIDMEHVQLPSGFEAPAAPQPGPNEQPISADDRAFLQMEIGALDDEGRADLANQWHRAYITPLGREDFTQADLARARALLRGVQATRARGGWDSEKGLAEVAAYLESVQLPEAPQEPTEAPEAEPPPEATSEDPGAVQPPPSEIYGVGPVEDLTPHPDRGMTSPDGVYRSMLDAIYLTDPAGDVEKLIEAVKALTVGDAASELERRGGDPFLPDDAARAELCRLIIDANPTDAPGPESEADEPLPRRAR